MFKKLIQLTLAAILVLPGLAAKAGAAHLPATGQTQCFNSRGDLIPCTGTGQDGENKTGVAWPAARFTDNGNGTLTDNLTGLIWSKNANAPDRALPAATPNACLKPGQDMSWTEALAFIKCLNAAAFAGSVDWRLPNPNELESVVNAGVPDSSAWLNSQGFGFPGQPQTGVRPGSYWTSGSDESENLPYSAWDVNLIRGDMPFSTLKNDIARRVWPVRGASNGPAPVSKTGQTACSDDLGDSCACSGTGEDGDELEGAVWPAGRIQPNAGATVAGDKLTGLIWATATQTTGPAACVLAGLDVTWQEALDHVKCLNQHAYLGMSNWRLPNKTELRSLADYSKGGPAFPSGHSFNDSLGKTYWSSTTDAAATNSALVVSMLDGSMSSANKTALLPALPVNGPDVTAPALTLNAVAAWTKNATQAVSGTVEGGATPMVTVNNGAPAAAAVTGVNWSAQAAGLAEGANTISVVASDLVGNVTTRTAAINVDTIPPALTVNAGSLRTKSSSHTISGTMEAGASPAVTLGSVAAPVTVSGTNWSAALSGLATGGNNITITATDQAGNVATKAAAVTVVIADGSFSGGVVSVADALKAMRMAVGLVAPTSDDLMRGDVAPLNLPDGKIDVADALMILKKAVGLVNF